MKTPSIKSLFISHGGGPLPLLGDAGHAEMLACLKQIADKLPKPDAIVVVSAHWEAKIPTITAAAAPELIYDYYGFPPEAYEIQYPCAGEPELAHQVHQALNKEGIDSQLDDARGFDHGLFIPMKIMYPKADIPCIQLSLVHSLNPQAHIEIGKALQDLNRENILVMGSGFSFHNLKAFFTDNTAQAKHLNQAFESWLIDTCSQTSYSEAERAQRLSDWALAEGARHCHPREEHLLPLHVCYGLAEAPCVEYFEINVLNKKASMYLW